MVSSLILARPPVQSHVSYELTGEQKLGEGLYPVKVGLSPLPRV